MPSDLETVEASAKWRVFSLAALLGFPLLLAGYLFIRVGDQLDPQTKLFVVVLFFVVWIPVAFWLGTDYISDFRFDRVGAHRSGVPLRGGKIRWSEMDKIRVAYGANAGAIFIHGNGLRFVLTSRTHKHFDEVAHLLRREANRRGIRLE